MKAGDDWSGGRQRAVARALSTVECGGEAAERLLRDLFGRTGQAHTIGITGSPGVGKSTLVQALGLELLGRGERVAVLAVDPSSPFTGGALLGDRVRMPDFVAAGGFVRSMATRGALGGLASATSDAIDVLDSAGFQSVVVETVGVGQDEVDIAGEVETVVVVSTAGAGDDVQAAKAGLMEIADVFAVNKADLPGADQQVAAIEGMLATAPPPEWTPPVVKVCATSGQGVIELIAAVAAHRSFLGRDTRRAALRRERAMRRIDRLLGAFVARSVRQAADSHARLVDEVAAGALDPYSAARRLLATIVKESG